MNCTPTHQLGRQVSAYQKEHQESFVTTLTDLVKMETPSLHPEAQQPILDYLQERLERLEFRCRRLPGPRSGGHLVAFPTGGRGKGQLLLGHCDTVWPFGTLEKMPVERRDGWLSGPGIYDMKSGVAQILFALETLQALNLEPRIPPVVFINSDEEVGSFESSRHIHRLAPRMERAFILEPSLGPTGKIKTARKGVGGFHVSVTGEAAHAGLEPDRGASAILELSYVIQKLFALNDADNGTTVNVGTIDGGLRPNVVAPESQARVDVRVLTARDAERVQAAIEAIEPTTPGVEVRITGRFGRPPLERTARNGALWEKAQKLAFELCLELEEGVAGGGSDGNTTSLYTATLDGLGAVGRGAHAVDEAIQIAPTLERTALLALLLMS